MLSFFLIQHRWYNNTGIQYTRNTKFTILKQKIGIHILISKILYKIAMFNEPISNATKFPLYGVQHLIS